MNIGSSLDLFVYFIIFIKVVFIITAITHLILAHSKNRAVEYKLDPRIMYWKERTEFIFTVCMSILLIYYFRPGHEHMINTETSILFFLFGCILLFTSKWSLFIKEAPWYSYIVSSMN